MARYRLTQEYDDLGPLATDLVDYFHDVHRFHFIKSLHSPAGGALLCVRRGRRAHPGGKEKKIVVKHGINDFRADEIPGETHILEALRGAQHICQLLALRHDVIPDGDERAYANAWWAYDEFPLVWENPYMVLEAISNGTLDDFIKKNEGNPMSQDMLWILFLCLIRSCIAMAYPPYGEPGVTPTRERIKPGVEKSGISHSDMHGGNIMFGDAWEDDEHYGCNPLRLIDFGISEWLEDVEAANAKNLREVGWNIVHLALMKPAPFLSPGSARKYNLDESTGLIIKSQSSSSASSQSNPPGNSDLSMGGSDNSNDQSGPKDASMMDVDDDDDYAPAADDPDDPEEYEDDDDGDLLGDVSMMSIDPNNLSGLSGSSIAQGSSPLPANASAMNISPGSAGGGGNNGGPVLRTFATLEFQNLPLADSFKILVSRCLAVDPEECPSLSQLLRVCKAEVAKIGDVDALTSQFTSMLMDADTEEYPDP